MRKLRLVVCVVILIGLTFGCGYNRIMIDHLSQAENYTQYDVTVVGISYRDADGMLYDFTEDSDISKASTVLLKVYLSSDEELAPFMGVSVERLRRHCEDTPVVLKINQENNQVLLDNGFYTAISMEDTITVTTSNWIYMDGEFFYVSALTYNGVEYLSEETGMSNIVAMMQKD